MGSTEGPRFGIGQMVLVDQGLPGKVLGCERGTVPGIRGLPPLNTWLYVIAVEDGGGQQTDIPEYNLVARLAE
jgi:hypothetical protein